MLSVRLVGFFFERIGLKKKKWIEAYYQLIAIK